MKKLVVALLCLAAAGCTRVPAGNVGVKVNLLGSDKGVDHEVVGVGRYWSGINEEYYLFPTFTQNKVFTNSRTEDSPEPEGISFQSMEGMSVSADVGVAYRIRPESVGSIFQKYRSGVDEITNIHLRNIIRDSFVKVSSRMSIKDMYGSGKAVFIEEVVDKVRAQVDGIGIDVENVYLVGDLRLPQIVIVSINAKIEATQKTIQRQNEIEQVKAEALKEQEVAKGRRLKQKELTDARTYNTLQVAIAEAEAIKLKGEMLKRYPGVIELSRVEKWDGILPRVTGGVVPFIDVNK